MDKIDLKKMAEMNKKFEELKKVLEQTDKVLLADGKHIEERAKAIKALM